MFTSPTSISLFAILLIVTVGFDDLKADTNTGSANLHAMVIGNGDYTAGKLLNPANDAKSISAALTDLGFQVTTAIDLSHQDMDLAITQFCQRIDDGGLAFFFFAGHGIQVNGENYLIPVDAEIPDQSHVKYKSVSLSLILDSLGNSRSNMNVVVLDCCRNNPFERTWQTRGFVERGLAAKTDVPEGTIIAYATSPNKTASDGDGDNSPYTKELAAALMERPRNGLLLRDVFFTASQAVKKKTGQIPWLNMEASLDNFYLRPSQDQESVPAPRPEPEMEIASASPAKVSLTKPSLSDAESLPPQTPAQAVSPEDKALIEQAAVYLRQGQYDNAIAAYSAILENPSLNHAARQQARKSRGAAYLGRGSKNDLNLAIIDQLAAGSDGIRLTVRANSADLKVGAEKMGNVSRGQVLLVTKSMAHATSDWFWVAAVNGDETLRGWVTASAVVKANDESDAMSKTVAAAISHPASTAVAAQPKPIQPTYASAQPVYQPPTSYSPTPSPNHTVDTRTLYPQQNVTPQNYPQQQNYVPQNNFNQQNQYQQSYVQPNYVQPSYRPTQPRNTPNYQTSNQTNQFQQSYRRPSTNSGQGTWQSNSGRTQQNSGAKSIWATPKWESPAEIRRGIANGTLKW